MGPQRICPEASRSRYLWLAVSLSVNLLLAVWLLASNQPHREDVAPAQFGSNNETAAAHKRLNQRATNATPVELPLFRWSEVESADYRQYIANLRAIG